MRILFYGDSNTYGYDPRGPVTGRYDEEKTWPFIADVLLENDEIFADGQNGRTIPKSDFDFEVLFNAIKRREPLDMLGIMLGSNDYINMFEPSPKEVISRMENALDKISDGFPTLKLLLMAPPVLKTSNVCYMQKYDTTDKSLSKAYMELAEKKGIPFFDTAAEPLGISYDGVHLSEDGHRQLAHRIADHINKIRDSQRLSP